MFKFLISLVICLNYTLKSFAQEDHEISLNSYGKKIVTINGLKKDLFQKYQIFKSKGPKWGKDLDLLAHLLDEDLNEKYTYWSESGYPFDQCKNFSQEDFTNAIEVGYNFSWNSIKRIGLNKKTTYYLATFQVTISSNNKFCTFDYNSTKYVFLNKLENKIPVYLGVLSEK